MKKGVAIMIVVLLMLTVVLSGCQSAESKRVSDETKRIAEQGDDLRHLSKLISEGTKEEYEKAKIAYYKKWYGENWQEEMEKDNKIGEEAVDKLREQLNK